MKQIIVIILVVFSISIASSQTRFESFQLPNSGQIDTVLSSNSNSAQVLGTGNQNFDLTSASSIIETPIKYEAVSSNASYPNANIKTTLGNGLGSIFLEKTQNDLLVRGLALNAGGFPLSFAMKGNLKYLTTPLYYNMLVNTSSDFGSVYLPKGFLPDSLIKNLVNSNPSSFIKIDSIVIDSIEIRLTVTSKLSADAYGKVSTPLESNVNCLRVLRDLNFKIGVYPKGRVKTQLSSNFNPIPDFLSDFITTSLLSQAPIPIPTSLKSHIFFADNSKPEVATATLDSLGKSYTSINYRKSSKAVSSIELMAKSNIDIVYKNNVADIFCNTISAKSVSLHNVMGQEVHHFRWMSPDARIDLNDLESGIYFLTIQENEKDKTVYKLFRP
jgi:hypothetical protein